MFLAVITILAITGLTVNGQIIPGVINGCSSTAFNDRLTQCYTDHNPPNIGTVGVENVVGLSARYVDAINACGTDDKAKYLAQTTCVLSAYRQCGDNDYKTLVMEETDYEKAFDYLCSNLAGLKAFEDCFNIDSINDCVTNKNAREKVTFRAQPDISNPFTDISDYHCKRLKIGEECVADDKDVAACVGSSNRALYEEFYKLRKGSVCGASSIILASGLMVISLVASFIKF